MKSFLLTSLIAAAAALPQYGGAPTPTGQSSVAVTTSAVGGYASGSAGSAATTPAATTKKHRKHKHKSHHGSHSGTGYQSITIGSTDGISGPAATGTGAYGTGKGKKSACTKKNKTVNNGAAPTGTGSGAGSGSGSGSGSAPSSSGAAAASTGAGSGSASTRSPASPSATAAPSNGTISTPSSNSTSASNTTADNSDFLRGINIGNWLILEKWMDNGKVFTGAFSGASDQWSFDSIDGSEAALQQHWSTWFTEDDVAKIAGYGFNALRIPIGYWAYDNSGTPFKQGAAYWMDQAIGWAAKHNMKVLVDLHGSPGSQNGQDHSGHAGAIKWQQDNNLQKSTDILTTMAKKYGAANYSSTVWGIEMVNEPTANSPNNFGTSQSWAQSAYEAMYKVLDNKSLRIVTHDSFRGPEQFIGIANDLTQKLPVDAKVLGKIPGGKSSGTTFGVDQHDYQLYTDSDNSLDQATHIKNACGWAGNLAKAKSTMPTIVGEWSSLTNICAKDDGSTAPSSQNPGGSCTSDDPSKWSPALVEQVRRYVEAQLDVYEQNTDGYFLWSWNGPGGWGVEGPANVGAFPKNVVSDRKYKGQCGGN